MALQIRACTVLAGTCVRQHHVGQFTAACSPSSKASKASSLHQHLRSWAHTHTEIHAHIRMIKIYKNTSSSKDNVAIYSIT